MTEVIKTERLTLRAPVMADAPAIARAANYAAVARWLIQMPHPYGVKDAEAFIAAQTSGQTFAICLGQSPIGCIGTKGEFGYWLTPAHWGKGLATEAGQAILAWHFEQSETPLLSGHAVENTRSRNVLVRLGFQDTNVSERRHHITGALRQQQNMTLSKAQWRARSAEVAA
ncbi:MAG: GNAT family N-acetyltransferase [Marinovum sp.]|nr:GNAT family N-acetyltransferase [Marinovum sp.]